MDEIINDIIILTSTGTALLNLVRILAADELIVYFVVRGVCVGVQHTG